MDIQAELRALYQEAVGLRSMGRLADAAAIEAKAAELLGRLKAGIAQTPDDPSSASALLFLAERDWTLLGDRPDVLEKIERALAIRETKLGPTHPLTAEALTKVAEFHYLSGRFGQADPLYRRAISILEKHAPAKDPVFAQALQGLAQTLGAMGRTEDADPYFAKAIEGCPTDDAGNRALYFLYIYRADGLDKLNRREEAEKLRQKAVTLLPKTNPGEFGFRSAPPGA